jgi:hypothetical protein
LTRPRAYAIANQRFYDEVPMVGRTFSFALDSGSADPEPAKVIIDSLIIAGWTGRDPDAVEHHIRELEALGVKRPASVPIFYRVSVARLTTDSSIQVLGEKSSGEVEFVLLKSQGRLWIGTGSDHTDREAETYGVSLSKQMCEKPVAPKFWAFDDVAGHWDRLVMRSYATIDGYRALYQEGPVSTILHPEELLSRFGRGGIPDGTIMFCGTLAAQGGVRPADRFDFELEDSLRKLKILHGYDIFTLPVPG